MSLKTLGLSIVIGSVFSGAKAFASSQYAVTKLDVSLKKLNDQKATLRVDSKEFAIALKKTQLLNDAITKLKVNSQKLEDISKGRDKFKSQMVDNIAMGATVAVPLKLSIDFESSMAQVRKVADFKNTGEFKKFGQDLLQMSTYIPIGVDGLAQISAAGGSLGVAQKDLLSFTKSVAVMSTAFDMIPEDAGDSMGKLMNIYGLTLKQVNALGDTINYLDNGMAAKSRDIVNVVARIGGTAKVFGLSADGASALSAAFLALGRPPEIAATGINAMLLKLKTADKQGKKFQGALKEMGMSASGLKASIDKDATGGLTTFLHTLSKVEKTKKMGILSDLFGMEYADDIALLAGGIKEYDKALAMSNDTAHKAGSMMKEFAIQSATTKNKLQTLTNTGTKLGINLGTVLLPGLIAIITPLQKYTSKLSDLSAKNETATTIIGGTTAGVVGFTLMASLAGYAISFITGGLIRLSSAWALVALNSKRAALWTGWATAKQWLSVASTTALTAAQWLFNIALNANPIGLIVLGITALIGLGVVLYNNFKPFADMMNSIGNTVGGWFGFSPNLGVPDAKIKTTTNPLTVQAPMGTTHIPANNYNAIKVPSIPTGGGRYSSANNNVTVNIANPNFTSEEHANATKKQLLAETLKALKQQENNKKDKSYSMMGA